MDKPEPYSMRVWWIPQVPGRSFHVPVESVQEARKILDVLADYDLFQFNNRIKGDYANTGGLLQWYDPECPDESGDCWVEWYSADGDTIDSLDLKLEDEEKWQVDKLREVAARKRTSENFQSLDALEFLIRIIDRLTGKGPQHEEEPRLDAAPDGPSNPSHEISG